jgi:hypothetical protein
LKLRCLPGLLRPIEPREAMMWFVGAALAFRLLFLLADEPVSREPVSEAGFPANREKNREFRYYGATATRRIT